MDIYNKRKAVGYIAYIGKVQEYKGNEYSKFLVRHLRPGRKIRVSDYWFSTTKETRKLLLKIEANDPVEVSFEIVTELADFTDKETGEHVHNYKMKLKANHVFALDGEDAYEWYWNLKDWMTSKEVQEIKKKYPALPTIISEGKPSLTETRSVKDYIDIKPDWEEREIVKYDHDVEDKLPF